MIRIAVTSAQNPEKPTAMEPSGQQSLWTAIILAGQRPEVDAMAPHSNGGYKALIPIAGQTMLERVARALMASSDIGRIVIMGQSPATLKAGLHPDLVEKGNITFVESHDGIAASIHGIIGTERAPWPVLATTADNPLLTEEILDCFFQAHDGQDVAVGVVERQTMLAAYPDARRTWLKFRGGAYSGANLFALHNEAAKPAVDFWSMVEQDRKKGWKIFAHFGPWLLLRAITRTIGFRQAMAKAGRRMNLRAEPIVLPIAEAAIDVDKPSDLELVTGILSAREG
ncbi:nucleotidyltransferase family protein [Parasphingorhabdus sp.]|uniref:nucleotidyltransferase family protein n=1 Tax=Parasphingorhabdus sp. TaxID=2709688 RepID=UPI003263DFB2